MTPTTAAVVPVNAAVRMWLPRSPSTYAVPRNTRHGTKVT